MIIKANSRKDGADLARYLLIENEHQKTFLLDYRGTVADNLRDMLTYWEAEATASTRGRKPLYHVQMRLAPGETIQQGQWLHTLDVLEKKLKLTDHPRAVVAHNLNGEAHVHVVYSRLNPERGVLLNMGNDRKSHHATARQMEKEFGLRELDSTTRRDRNGNEKTRSIEHKMAKEAGTTRKALCTMVKAAWDSSSTGRQFQEHMSRFGFTMTRGDRRDYNVWHNGKRYDPVRLIENVRTAEFRAKMQIEPPRIAERSMSAIAISTNSLIRRKAVNLTYDQLVRDYVNDNLAPSSERAVSMTRRKAKDMLAADFANDNAPAPISCRVPETWAEYQARRLRDGHVPEARRQRTEISRDREL